MASNAHFNRTRRMRGGEGIASFLGFGETKVDPEKRLSKLTSDISSMMEKLQEELTGYEMQVKDKMTDLRKTEHHVNQTMLAYKALESALAKLNSTGEDADANISEEGNDEDGTEDEEEEDSTYN
jgi:hypothetical protein